MKGEGSERKSLSCVKMWNWEEKILGATVGRRGRYHGFEIRALETQILLAILFLSNGVIWTHPCPSQSSVFFSVKQESSLCRQKGCPQGQAGKRTWHPNHFRELVKNTFLSPRACLDILIQLDWETIFVFHLILNGNYFGYCWIVNYILNTFWIVNYTGSKLKSPNKGSGGREGFVCWKISFNCIILSPSPLSRSRSHVSFLVSFQRCHRQF